MCFSRVTTVREYSRYPDSVRAALNRPRRSQLRRHDALTPTRRATSPMRSRSRLFAVFARRAVVAARRGVAAPGRDASVPPDWLFIEVDVHLFGFEIFLDAKLAKFAAEARLFVASPGSLYVRRLHVVDPDDARTDRLHHSHGLVDVTRPHRGGEAIRRVVGDAQRVLLVVERDHRADRAENFFAGNPRVVVHVVEDGWFDIEPLAVHCRPVAARRHLRLILAEFLVRAHSVELLLAHE